VKNLLSRRVATRAKSSGDGDHLQAVRDGPVVADRAAELDTRLEGIPCAGRIEPELRVPTGVERSGSGPLIAEGLGHGKRLGCTLHGRLEVVAVERDVGGTPESPGSHDRGNVVCRERLREPPGASREMTAQFPEERERGDQTQERLAVVRGVGPLEGSSEIVVIGLEVS
jgi:hypothetical protein